MSMMVHYHQHVMIFYPILHRLIHVTFIIHFVAAILVNVTVDDALPDPTTGESIIYFPENAWSEGGRCPLCVAHPDGQLMNDGTWHDGTYFPALSSEPATGPLNATFSFNGSAIYVFCALSLQTTAILNSFTNMSFFIDGEMVGQFQRIPPGINGFQYNVPVYSNIYLSPGNHIFTLLNGETGNAGNESLTLFDYIVYSYDDGMDTDPEAIFPSSNCTCYSSKSIIISGVLGAVVSFCITVALAICCCLFYKARSAYRTRRTQRGIEPFVAQISDPTIRKDQLKLWYQNYDIKNST